MIYLSWIMLLQVSRDTAVNITSHLAYTYRRHALGNVIVVPTTEQFQFIFLRFSIIFSFFSYQYKQLCSIPQWRYWPIQCNGLLLRLSGQWEAGSRFRIESICFGVSNWHEQLVGLSEQMASCLMNFYICHIFILAQDFHNPRRPNTFCIIKERQPSKLVVVSGAAVLFDRILTKNSSTINVAHRIY